MTHPTSAEVLGAAELGRERSNTLANWSDFTERCGNALAALEAKVAELTTTIERRDGRIEELGCELNIEREEYQARIAELEAALAKEKAFGHEMLTSSTDWEARCKGLEAKMADREVPTPVEVPWAMPLFFDMSEDKALTCEGDPVFYHMWHGRLTSIINDYAAQVQESARLREEVKAHIAARDSITALMRERSADNDRLRAENARLREACDAAESRASKAESYLQEVLAKVASKHRPAYDEQQKIIMDLRDKNARLTAELAEAKAEHTPAVSGDWREHPVVREMEGTVSVDCYPLWCAVKNALPEIIRAEVVKAVEERHEWARGILEHDGPFSCNGLAVQCANQKVVVEASSKGDTETLCRWFNALTGKGGDDGQG
jgi:hypothetical protein